MAARTADWNRQDHRTVSLGWLCGWRVGAASAARIGVSSVSCGPRLLSIRPRAGLCEILRRVHVRQHDASRVERRQLLRTDDRRRAPRCTRPSPSRRPACTRARTVGSSVRAYDRAQRMVATVRGPRKRHVGVAHPHHQMLQERGDRNGMSQATIRQCGWSLARERRSDAAERSRAGDLVGDDRHAEMGVTGRVAGHDRHTRRDLAHNGRFAARRSRGRRRRARPCRAPPRRRPRPPARIAAVHGSAGTGLERARTCADHRRAGANVTRK